MRADLRRRVADAKEEWMKCNNQLPGGRTRPTLVHREAPKAHTASKTKSTNAYLASFCP